MENILFRKTAFFFHEGLDFDDYRDEERLFACHTPDGASSALMADFLDRVEGIVVGKAFFQRSHEDLGNIAKKDFAIAGKDNAAGLDVWSCHHLTGFFGNGHGDDDDTLGKLLAVLNDGAADIADADAERRMKSYVLKCGAYAAVQPCGARCLYQHQVALSQKWNDGLRRIDNLVFSLATIDEKGQETIEEQPSTLGNAPLFLVINGNTAGKFFWPLEANNIGIAYPGFSVWGSNVLTAVDWYDVSNATRGRIVSY